MSFCWQPDFFIYESVERFGDLAMHGPLVWRLGTGICGARATIEKDVVEALRPAGGGRYRAYRYGIIQLASGEGVMRARAATASSWSLSWAAMKIMLNHFLYRPKDGRLRSGGIEALRSNAGMERLRR